MPFISFSPILIWFLAGIIFFGLELLLPGLIVFFFGVGAWCAALAVYLLPIPLSGQLLVFLGASVVALVLLRATLKKVFLGRQFEKDAMENKAAEGSSGVVIEDIIPPAAGKIKYAGSFWQATAEEPLAKGTVVRVVEKNNLTVKVCATETQGEI